MDNATCEGAFLRGFRDAGLQLTLVGGTIEVALRLGDEAILPELPHLEAADANPMTGAAWPV